MIRKLGVLTLVTVLVACAQPQPAQPRSSPLTFQAALEEARRLNQQAEKLYGEAKYGEAVPIAERALALRENALGPMHPNVAQSLNTLAALYWAQGA
jgi:tetratricopeptide repeat protein